jgi:hypothetical protein
MLVATSRAQTPASTDAFSVVSPYPGQYVEPGALFVVIEVDPGIVLDRETLVLLVDDVPVDVEPKVSSTSVRYLVRDALAPGSHRASFSARASDGRALESLQWLFNVSGSVGATARSSSAARLRGTTYFGSRNADFSGNRGLRQEPLATYVARTDLTASYGVFTFPIRAYLTTDESRGSQPRNRVLVGVESPWFSVYGGDTQPGFSPLTLAGARARGVLAEVHVPGVSLSVTRGRLRRAVDIVSPSGGSTAVNPFQNTYRRTMTGARLAFGSERTVEFSLHGLKAVDDTSSIAFGARPLENLVAGSDLTIKAWSGRISFDTGAALSLTTEDRSRGVSDKAELDSLFDVDLPIDPSDFGWLITLNPTTVPLRFDRLSSLAWYTLGRADLGDHRVTAEFRSIGSAFYSAGNPFLINDRRSVSVSDRFAMADDRVTGTVRVHWYGSQPDDLGLASLLSSWLYSGNVNYRVGPNLPTVMTGLRFNTRTRGEGEAMTSDSKMLSISLGALQQFETGSQRHTVQVTATRTTRTDRINESIDNRTMTIGLGLYEQFSDRLTANVQVTYIDISYPNLDGRQRWTSLSGGLSKRLASTPLRFTGQARYSHASASSFLSGSNRYGGGLTAAYDLQRNMTIELQVGLDTFRDSSIDEARYTERFVSLRHRYRF